jgi:hypothetical protein
MKTQFQSLRSLNDFGSDEGMCYSHLALCSTLSHQHIIEEADKLQAERRDETGRKILIKEFSTMYSFGSDEGTCHSSIIGMFTMYNGNS